MPEETTLTIEKLVYGGDGLSRLDGRVVFIPFVLPGEVVRAEILASKNELLRGKLVEITAAAASRVTPACPYFERCGGCQYQHAGYDYELAQKREILREALRRIGKIEFAGEIETIAGEPWQYRNRVQLHIHNGQAGYFQAGSHVLCPIEACPVSSPKLNGAIAQLARDLPQFRWFSATAELFTNEAEVQVNVLDRVPASVRPLFEAVGSGESIRYGAFRVSRNSFFQVNRFLVEALVGAAMEGLEGGTALDLYAGVGLFSMALARKFERVTAVESGWSAYRDLEFNVQASGAAVTAVHGTTEEYLEALDVAPDAVIADPPRAGLGKHAVAELARLAPREIAIVSCDPATLARDLAGLLTSGYKIAKLTLVDLFPHTFHIETVARLRRTGPDF